MYTPTTFHSTGCGLGKVLGELEAHILDALWQSQPATVSVVKTILETTYKPISYNAVMTVLNRLVEKKLIKKTKMNGVFHYKAVHTKAAMEKSVASSMLTALVKDTELFGVAKFDSLAESVDKKTLQKLREFLDSVD